MGYDAYHLVGNLYSSGEKPIGEIIGATGRLYLDGDGRVHRKLAWARFENGVPVPLPEDDEFQFMLDELDADPAQDQTVPWREMPLER